MMRMERGHSDLVRRVWFQMVKVLHLFCYLHFTAWTPFAKSHVFLKKIKRLLNDNLGK